MNRIKGLDAISSRRTRETVRAFVPPPLPPNPNSPLGWTPANLGAGEPSSRPPGRTGLHSPRFISIYLHLRPKGSCPLYPAWGRSGRFQLRGRHESWSGAAARWFPTITPASLRDSRDSSFQRTRQRKAARRVQTEPELRTGLAGLVRGMPSSFRHRLNSFWRAWAVSNSFFTATARTCRF